MGTSKSRAVVHEAIGGSVSLREAAAVIALGVLALDIIGVAPVLLGALQDEGRLSASGLGVAAMLEMFAMGLATGLCGALLPPKRLRTAGVIASFALAALDFASAGASGGGVLALRTAAGVPEGVMIWITVGMIARSETPERWAALFFTSQVAAQLALAGAFWLWVLPRTGGAGGFWALGLTTLLGAPIALLAPRAYGALAQAAGLSGAPPLRGWAALIATAVFVSANGAITVYLEPIAHQAGVSADGTRLAVFASLVAQLGGGAAAVYLAGRVRYMTVFTVCAATYLFVWASYAFVLPAWAFVTTTVMSGAVSLLVGPFLTPMIIAVDPTRRAAMQSAGAQIFGGAGGPLAAACVVSERNVHGVLILAAATLVTGLAMMFALTARQAPR